MNSFLQNSIIAKQSLRTGCESENSFLISLFSFIFFWIFRFFNPQNLLFWILALSPWNLYIFTMAQVKQAYILDLDAEFAVLPTFLRKKASRREISQPIQIECAQIRSELTVFKDYFNKNQPLFLNFNGSNPAKIRLQAFFFGMP